MGSCTEPVKLKRARRELLSMQLLILQLELWEDLVIVKTPQVLWQSQAQALLTFGQVSRSLWFPIWLIVVFPRLKPQRLSHKNGFLLRSLP